jgi:cell division protein FtsB
MLFIDSNNIFAQFSQRKKISELLKQEKFYKNQIISVEKDRQELLTNDELLEKFAREKYFMKKNSEDLYILVEE